MAGPSPRGVLEVVLRAPVTYVMIQFVAVYLLYLLFRWLIHRLRVWFEHVPAISVPLPTEAQNAVKVDPKSHVGDRTIPCYDPSTMRLLGTVPAMNTKEVNATVDEAWKAAKIWKRSTFDQRRLLLKILQKFTVEHQEDICRVSARDSGKVVVDALFGELMVTCEKFAWLRSEGEKYLRPEKRSAGVMMFYKSARVEYHPVGVVGAIIPWNYPFHNFLNPVSAAVFAGNAIVVKVSEQTSWSSQYYMAAVKAALAAAGAPPNLVQIVTGYAEAGSALASAKLGKLIFVGSTAVGKKVMETAAKRLTPVVLELGGKDPVIIFDNINIAKAVPFALRAAFQSCGQNCAGGERFIVHARIYDKFLHMAVETVKRMTFGEALGSDRVDMGAMCLPGLAEKVHSLVQDAVSKGAKLLIGGELPQREGQFYPPTILADVTNDMKIWTEEVFGPVMAVVPFDEEEEAVHLANDCPFGLGSNVFSSQYSVARRVGACLDAGMTNINDFGTTYMCQSLPFGGIKDSGFDRFAGVEGLRGLCVTKSVCEDWWPFLMTTNIPPALQYPVKPHAGAFVQALVKMFYSLGWKERFQGLIEVAKCSLSPSSAGSSKKE
ncbi:unnamed protein product [Ostreobium quekettii]|uniref:Aldehyde dehydrogenase domain-containing protein n=1 Tax=Ostreobium quekettii TaxID=121088 RepID=A0A8S1IV65_9CHLO|nr:unnamed protein product [Ostreobium quekettii]|eukprot:evm.model.scf_167.14 EVM.evm.TU.scf_167.14   scf_167:95380-102443(+)